MRARDHNGPSPTTAAQPAGDELHAAVREVTAAYNALPAAVQVRIGPACRDGLDAELRAAREAGDRDRALAAIRAWRAYWLAEFEDTHLAAGGAK